MALRSKWPEVAEIVTRYDVTAITETKLDTNASSSSFDIPGYSMFRQDRNARGGRVMTFMKDMWLPVGMSELQEKHTAAGIELTISEADKGETTKPDDTSLAHTDHRSSSLNWFEDFSEGTARANAL